MEIGLAWLNEIRFELPRKYLLCVLVLYSACIYFALFGDCVGERGVDSGQPIIDLVRPSPIYHCSYAIDDGISKWF